MVSAVPAGEVIARDERKGMALRRTDGPLRLAYRVSGIYPGDTWSGRHATYTRLRCRGGSVTAEVASDPLLFSGPQTVRAAGRSVTFDPSNAGSLTVPLRPRNGVCSVVYTVTPTAVPARVLKGSSDSRELGVHFLAFRYAAP